jgi:organic radical activating enzyme
MTLEERISQLKQQYEVLSIVDLDAWHTLDDHKKKFWLREQLESLRRDAYTDNQRLVFTLSQGDRYADQLSDAGVVLTDLQRRLWEVDISNFFVILLTTDTTVPTAYEDTRATISQDPVPITIEVYSPDIAGKVTQKPRNVERRHAYNSVIPIKADWDNLNEREQNLLVDSPTFCIYPWIHLHAYPTGSAYPCCVADMQHPIGDMRQHTMKEIWNQGPMREIRRQMLNDQPVTACNRCYEQEKTGFMSLRQSANKHHGHHIDRVAETKTDGTLDRFELTYWDIRFSNLCNLRCRSCGHIFSSQWYQDQAKLAGGDWAKKNKVLNYAGRFETDAWDQLVEHIDYLEQIYFAGGEPLLMEEHYKILDELERRGMYHVRLIYNTNFTHTDLKGRSVFDYWKKFESVSVGASLDDSGMRGEYIRKGTNWDEVEQNRRDMMNICPEVDFYISPTLSIMNAEHLPKFHRDWVERGLIRAQDLNVNILQDPAHYRIDIAPHEYKKHLETVYREHIEWLRPYDTLKRAITGFESAITFMNSTDNTHLIDTFWRKTYELDAIRNELVLDIIPELKALK